MGALTTQSLIFGGGYAEGAVTSTAGKPLYDGNIDRKDPSFPKKIREQNKYLLVNDTNIPTILTANTVKTIGVSVGTQVESPSKLFNSQAEALIDEHGKLGVGELTGRHHFNKALRIISSFELLDGGIIVRHHYNTAWAIPYKYELIGVDMIDISKTDHFYNITTEESTLNGLVRNKWNQITHVWLYDTETKTTSTKISYDDLTYYSDTWISIDQQTATSKLVSLLKTLDMSVQYGVAELQSAIESSKAGAYMQSQAYNEVMKVVSSAIASKIGNSANAKSIAEAIDLVKPIMRQLSNLGVKPHGVTPIPSDDNIIFNSSKSDSQYKTLNDNTEMKMASSLGMSDIGTFKKASSANYSSIKATIEFDQQTADVRFDDIKNIILFDIHTRLIRVGVQIGKITERVAYWKNPYAFNKFRYLRLNKIDIEPAKNATANEKNIKNGLKTEAEIIESSQGIKYEDFTRKRLEQEEFKAEQELQLEIKLLKKRQKAFETADIQDPMIVEENPTVKETIQ